MYTALCEVIKVIFIRMDFLIPLIKDCEDKPKNKTIGINLKRKEKEKFKEHLIKEVRNTNIVNDNDCILKESRGFACGQVLTIDNLLTENKPEIKPSLAEIEPSMVVDENYD